MIGETIRQPAPIDENLVPWVWAYCEQLTMHAKHDKRWIVAAENGWPGQTLYDFLKTYKLIRGDAAKLFKEGNHTGRQRFQQICEKHFQRDLPQVRVTPALRRRWHKAVEDVFELRHALGTKRMNLYSATSKMFWFYQPDAMVMFDSNNFDALARWGKRTGKIAWQKDLTTENFLKIFDAYFEEEAKPKIAQTEILFSVRYPYPKRIAEKCLWLYGRDGLQ